MSEYDGELIEGASNLAEVGDVAANTFPWQKQVIINGHECMVWTTAGASHFKQKTIIEQEAELVEAFPGVKTDKNIWPDLAIKNAAEEKRVIMIEHNRHETALFANIGILDDDGLFPVDAVALMKDSTNKMFKAFNKKHVMEVLMEKETDKCLKEAMAQLKKRKKDGHINNDQVAAGFDEAYKAKKQKRLDTLAKFFAEN